MAKTDVMKNSRQIERFLEILLPKMEPGGGCPETPMNRKERGSSRPPVSEYVMRLWKSNPDLGPITKVLKQAQNAPENICVLDVPIAEITATVLYDHTAIRNWKGQGGRDELRFRHYCLLLAQRLAAMYDEPDKPYIIQIEIEPTDEPQRQKTRHGQKVDTRYTNVLMVEQLAILEAETGLKGRAAMETLGRKKAEEAKAKGMPDPNWSLPRLRKAREMINRENRMEAVA